tara:strand:- start:527 stop:727 length:201 start_codon:yes stop_codon:yes gene_type:complete
MNKFELLLDRLIESEMQRKDLALSNQKLSYQYQELDKNSRIEINLLNSKITDYEYSIRSKAEPKTK